MVSSNLDASEQYDVVVIGAGFAGLYALYKARDMGFRTIAFEAGKDVGGVWYWNRYPGARCDTPSYCYSYSFSPELEQEWDWSLDYSEQPEIQRYLSHVADRFHLREHIQFETRVSSAHFDDVSQMWRVGLSNGDTVVTRFIIAGTGCLSAPIKPDFPDFDKFKGEVYYTAQWPHEGVDLAGKKVGLVGTGASGAQAIPIIAREATHLTVFQRTANWVLPVWNGPMDAEFRQWVKANYEQIRSTSRYSPAAFPWGEMGVPIFDEPARNQEKLSENWKKGGMHFVYTYDDVVSNPQTNALYCEFMRHRIKELVKDQKVAAKLTPDDHPFLGKRPPMDDNYYTTFNRENVSLVDIRAEPFTRFDERGVHTGDQYHELDVLVMATGFDAMTGPLSRIDVRGRGGAKLQDKWADGPMTYLGLAIAGFPNLFMITGPFSPSVAANMPTGIEHHVDMIASCLEHMREQDCTTVEADPIAEEQWVEHSAEVAGQTLLTKTSSWYVGANIPGKAQRYSVYVGGFGNYRMKCDSIIKNGFEGFIFN